MLAETHRVCHSGPSTQPLVPRFSNLFIFHKIRQILAKSAVCLFYQSVRVYQSNQTSLAEINLLDKARDFNLVQHSLCDVVLTNSKVVRHMLTSVEPTLEK